MDEFIAKSRASQIVRRHGGSGASPALREIDQEPPADVVEMEQICERVDEALRLLNAINSSGRLDYGDYFELYDVIGEIDERIGACT